MKRKIEYILKKFFLDEEYKVSTSREIIYITIWRDQIHIKKSTIKYWSLKQIEDWIRNEFDLD